MSGTRGDDIDKRQARRAFDRAARGYEQAAVLQREVESRLLERLDLIRIRPRRILDLGAGTGRGSEALLRRYRGARLLALDLAPGMLALTRRRGRWPRRPWCVCGDAERLPLASGAFDLVYSSLMLQWCPEPARVFAELRRVLAPGGLLLFTSFGPDTLWELREAWSRADGFQHVHRFIDMHDLGDALLGAGFADPVMDAERITVTYAQALDLMRDLKQIGAHNVAAGRPRGLTGRGRLDAMLRAYEAHRRDGRLPASYEVLYGHAWAPQAGVAVAPPQRRRS